MTDSCFYFRGVKSTVATGFSRKLTKLRLKTDGLAAILTRCSRRIACFWSILDVFPPENLPPEAVYVFRFFYDPEA